MRTLTFVALGLVAALALSMGGVAADGDVLVVDGDDEGAYNSIQAAVDAAEPGDTVLVRPGTYHESVTVDSAVKIVAPDGATLDGSDSDGPAIDVETDADVIIDGLTITGYERGIAALGTAGDWEVRNVIVRNVEFSAIAAGGTDGDWTVSNVSIRNVSTGVAAESSAGDWSVTDTTIRNVSIGHGIEAVSATGDWTLHGVTVANVHWVGVAASFTEGNWRARNVTVRNATVGISAIEAAGDWSIRGSTIIDASVSDRFDFRQPALKEGVGLYARDTTGAWSVHGTRFDGNEAGGIVAEGADPDGNGTHNWWGEGGPECAGNVICEPSQTAWHPEQAISESPTSTPPSTVTEPPTPATIASETGNSTEITSTSAPGFNLWVAAVLGLGTVAAMALGRRY